MTDPVPGKRGAPFDKDNLWNVQAIDAGDIRPESSAGNNIRFLGADFVTESPRTIDGGEIPKQGTATYDAAQDYGPDSPLIED